jgi:hypothetical protein
MLRRRSIRLRIVVLVLVPAVALLGVYAEVLSLTLSHLLTLRHEAAIRQAVTRPVLNVQRQLGKERTLAVQYLAGTSSIPPRALLTQEQETDIAVARFRGAVQTALSNAPVPAERQAILSWRGRLAGIGGLRTSVQNRGITKNGAAEAYSGILTEGDNVITQADVAVLTGPLLVQAADVLTMTRASQAVGEESDLLRGDLLAGSFSSASLTQISGLAVQHSKELLQTLPKLDPVLRGYFRPVVQLSASQSPLTVMEAKVAKGATHAAKVPLQMWTTAADAYQQAFLQGLLKSQATLTRKASNQVGAVEVRLALIAGIGLVAIVIAVVVGIAMARGLIRQLTELRQSAVRLATDQLPGTISRLRAGQDVDVGAEVPQLRPSSDEIGQVRQAFNVAARTALIAAAEEVRIRRGVNDVFRSLARRNQSLLTRQLQLLDSMERRVHDPEELADLFRVDHMTTRMRRHAEGLLIVAGGSSGRTWREAVPIVDVMRAAAAEVEDYPRIRVTSRTGAALAGHVVADIIHLLAELIENAATFSPAGTPVRVDGERVARGVAVEIEDRGLGMGEQQLAAINATLADPPLFDLSGSDQLGLFIAGQLAKRHDVRLTLRGSAFGGVTAVVLIPSELIVDTGEPEEPLSIAGIRELGGRPVPELPAAFADPGRTIAASAAGTAYIDNLGALNVNAADQTDRSATSEIAAEPEAWPVTADFGEDPTATYRAATDPIARGLPRRQPGITGLRRQSPGENADLGLTVSSGFSDESAAPTNVRAAVSEPAPADESVLAAAAPVNDEPIDGATATPELLEVDGLPIRVPQANLAPQLRNVAGQAAAVGDEPAAGPSPEAARSTMAALQLGWQRGRSVAETAVDDLPAGPHPQSPGEHADEGGSP